jgi:hypothetical protein
MDEFTTVQADLKGPGYQGWWDHILPQLTEEQTANLNLAAASHGISHRTISIVLTRWKVIIPARNRPRILSRKI